MLDVPPDFVFVVAFGSREACSDERFEFIEFTNFWNVVWVVGIRQGLADLLDPVNHSGVWCTAFTRSDSLRESRRHRSKSHAFRVHQQAFSLDFLRVALRWVIALDELLPTVYTDMILLAFAFSIFPNVSRLAFWALHKV